MSPQFVHKQQIHELNRYRYSSYSCRLFSEHLRSGFSTMLTTNEAKALSKLSVGCIPRLCSVKTRGLNQRMLLGPKRMHMKVGPAIALEPNETNKVKNALVRKEHLATGIFSKR
ncbi:uncharacterized protein [Physcomitrium patens]|uniref:uncharacterized protein n=1 Tax=Physcomitrium patens TaxID=3218 RepID=UPI003CCE3885